MKPETARMPSPAASLDGCKYDDARIRGFGLTHLSGFNCTGASSAMPPWRRQARAFTAVHLGT